MYKKAEHILSDQLLKPFVQEKHKVLLITIPSL